MDKMTIRLPKTLSDKERMTLSYRYISWAVTSFFYLAMEPYSTFGFKLGVILSLLVTVAILTDLLIKNKENPHVVRLIILAEILGTSLLLLPTGGIESPFIWYALNPVLLAASYLSSRFCWTILFIFFTTATLANYSLFGFPEMSFLKVLENNSYIYLVLTLITLIFQQFSNLTNQLQNRASELKETNARLTDMNQQSNEMMQHIMSLYQTTESFTNQHNLSSFASTVVQYVQKLTGKTESFMLLETTKKDESLLETTAGINKSSLLNMKKLLFSKKDAGIITHNGTVYMVAPIRSTNYSGYLGLKQLGVTSSGTHGHLLKFMTELTSIVLERYDYEEASKQFIVMEEQNRIANEIHDSVSQRLFAMVCGLHSLGKRVRSLSTLELEEELRFMASSANSAMQELRSSIYQLNESGTYLLFPKINSFLDEFAKLHCITVSPLLEGKEADIPATIKTVIYRIICEASGNAVRHGKCTTLSIHLNVTQERLSLCIVDNGSGFNVEQQQKRMHKGLGLGNIRNLVKFHHGMVKITSEPKIGTKISIEIPITHNSEKEVVGL